MYGEILSEILTPDYEVVVLTSGEAVLAYLAENPKPDLILLDILMPGQDGLVTCEKIKAVPGLADIPLIFLSIMSSPDTEARGLEMGAVDYITKPISAPIVKARVQTHLRLAEYTRSLENEIQQRISELSHTQDVAMYCMASLAETRDQETGNHILRTQHYVLTLANYLQTHSRFKAHLSEQAIDLIFRSAPLHDIGKVGVPDRILHKPGKHNEEEWQEMQRHAEYGYEAILRAEERMGSTSFLDYAKEITYTHHERWDGSGYPRGLQQEETPVSGRLMAVADVYDALISERVYKPAFPHEDARSYILEQSGKHFDPAVVDAFIACENRFIEIAAEFSDNE